MFSFESRVRLCGRAFFATRPLTKRADYATLLHVPYTARTSMFDNYFEFLLKTKGTSTRFRESGTIFSINIVSATFKPFRYRTTRGTMWTGPIYNEN